MSSPLWRPQQWDAHVPPHLKEPFPWAHPNHRGTFHPFSNPRNTLLFGALLVLAGIVILITGLTRFADTGEGGAIAVGVMMLVGLGAIGGFGIHVGSTRLRWIRRFRDEYGFSPFDRQPDAAVPPRGREHG